MAHKLTVAVYLVRKMKLGRGIDEVVDTLRDTYGIAASFRGGDSLEMSSDNKDMVEIADEWLERKYGGKQNTQLSEMEVQTNVADGNIVWTFSERFQPELYQFYLTEIKRIPNLKHGLSQDSRITLMCKRNDVSQVRPKVMELHQLIKGRKEDSIDCRNKGKSAKLFCEDNKEENCLCSWDHKNKKIILIGKYESSIKKVKDAWESFLKEREKAKTETKDGKTSDLSRTHKDEPQTSDDGNNKEKSGATKEKVPSGTLYAQPPKQTYDIVKAPRAVVSESKQSDDEKVRTLPRNKPNETDNHEARTPGAFHNNPSMATGGSMKGSDTEGSIVQGSQKGGATSNTRASDIVGSGVSQQNQYTFQVGSIKVMIYKHSVVELRGMDAIVNAANDHLAHAGGIAYYISKAAGKSMDDECNKHVKKHGALKNTEVFVSKPGNMKCKGIFHAVGPRWSEYRGQVDECAKDVYKTVLRCLECMDERKWKTIALCAISSGIFGVPQPLCTAMYLKAIEDFAKSNPTSKIEVHFIDVNQDMIDLMIKTHEERVSLGYSPDFKIAFRYPSAHMGYQGRQGGMMPPQGRYDGRGGGGFEQGMVWGKDEYGGGPRGAALYKYNTPTFYREDGWREYIPERVDDLQMDIDAFCKGSAKTDKGKDTGKKSTGKKPEAENVSEGTCVYHPKEPAVKKLPCGHTYCKKCFPNSKTTCQKCKVDNKSKKAAPMEKAEAAPDKLECPICMEEHATLATLPCSHGFCKDCLKKASKVKPICPTCNIPFGVVTGTQPDGRMFERTVRDRGLPGYEHYGTIEIGYEFKDGKQKECHPHPAKPYKGIARKAYLPDSAEGRKVLRLLKKAFSRRLIFTIGDSRTTGQSDQITWNDIHHKTSNHGGQFGYPDNTYLTRVQDELAAKGITD